jgi:hypothetical protein
MARFFHSHPLFPFLLFSFKLTLEKSVAGWLGLGVTALKGKELLEKVYCDIFDDSLVARQRNMQIEPAVDEMESWALQAELLPTTDAYVEFINNSNHKFNLAEHPDTAFNNAAVKAMIPRCLSYIKGNYLEKSFPESLLQEQVLTHALKALIFSMAQRIKAYKIRIKWTNKQAMQHQTRYRRRGRRYTVSFQTIVCVK